MFETEHFPTKHALMISLIMTLRGIVQGQLKMKKCHSCGTISKDSQKTLREFGGEYYCDDCVNADGKPKDPNPVRKSILSFWRARETPGQDSIDHGS